MNFIFLICIVLFGFCQAAQAGTYWQDQHCVRSVPSPTLSSKIFPKQSFVLDSKNGKGIEKVILNDKTELTIINAGCEYFALEYQFKFQNRLLQTDAKFWYKKAIEMLGTIAEANASPVNLKKAMVRMNEYLNSPNPKLGEELDMSQTEIREFIVVNLPDQNSEHTILKIEYYIGPL